MTIKHFVWMCFCISVLYSQVAIGGKKSEPEISEFRIGVWELRFTNKVNSVTYDHLKTMVDISSDLTVSIRKGVQNVHLEGIIVNAKPSKLTTCVVCVDNHTSSYELSAMMQQPLGAKISISIRENDANIATGKFYSIQGGLVTVDGQLNILPTLADSDGKTLNCYLVAVKPNDQSGSNPTRN